MKKIALKIIYKRLADIATSVIKQHHPIIIVITGSVGKTSAKEAIKHVLCCEYKDDVRATYGNLNAEIGLPLTILGYDKLPNKSEWPLFLLKISKHLKDKKYPKYLVLEMGVEHPGDIDYLSKIAPPDIAVITAATPAHVINFKNLAEMQKEKLILAQKVKTENIFFNIDDEYLNNNISSKNSYSVINKKAKIYAENIEVTVNGNKYDLVVNGQKYPVSNRLLGKQMIYSDLAAAGVAEKLGMDLAKISESLKSRAPFNGRMNLIKGERNITVIDDTYNANPASMKAAIDTIDEIKYSGRKVAVIGNMNELGDISEEEHIKIAKYAQGKVDLLIFVGPNSQKMLDALNSSQKSLAYTNRLEVEKRIDKIIQENDLILCKASQNKNYFEELVKVLLDKNIKADEVLVRQGAEWANKKNNF